MTPRAIGEGARQVATLLPAYLVARVIERLSRPERRALREIAEGADLIEAGGQWFLLAPVSAETIDTLAAVDADLADCEPEACEGSGDEEPEIKQRASQPALERYHKLARSAPGQARPAAKVRLIAGSRA